MTVTVLDITICPVAGCTEFAGLDPTTSLCAEHQRNPTLSWLGPNMSFRPELIEVMARLIDDKVIGSIHLAALEPHATYEEVNDALTACQDALTEERDKRQVYRGEDPATDRLEKIYNALAAAIDHYDRAERELEQAGEDALTAKQLFLGELG